MARLARIVIPSLPHHITQRGNRKQPVFFSEMDRWVYVRLLRTAAERHGVQIWAWCLMTNHVHLIAIPTHTEAFAACFTDVHGRYTKWVNRKHVWQGHLWQARYSSSAMDERYLIAAVRYVERNPVRAGLVSRAWEYRWSSAAWHVQLASQDPLVSGDGFLRERINNWRDYLGGEELADELMTIRQETRTNRPLGSEHFIRALEQQTGRALMRKPKGRPRKY